MAGILLLSPIETVQAQETTREPSIYIVTEGDTLSQIAEQFELGLSELLAANNLEEDATIQVGQQLLIPGSDGTLPEPIEAEGEAAVASTGEESVAGAPVLAPLRASPEDVWGRQTLNARRAAPNSPLYRTTWVTYYGRPGVDLMGILGEYSIEDLVPRLAAQATAYDEANGPDMGVMPAFHLVYGMATQFPGEDGDHLVFMTDEAVESYIEAAQEHGWSVILDIQIGNRDPLDAMSEGFRWLSYPNVHLAIDPEFAMVHPDQERPGVPIGFVTGAQVNQIQRAMRDHMRENDLPDRRILILHQFLHRMIPDKEDITSVYKVDLVITADGWGEPTGKVVKYNNFTSESQKFTGFKLFYKWDEPLLNEREVLGIDNPPNVEYMEVTPNLIIYQ
jgi:LysM repeat protein